MSHFKVEIQAKSRKYRVLKEGDGWKVKLMFGEWNVRSQAVYSVQQQDNEVLLSSLEDQGRGEGILEDEEAIYFLLSTS